MIPLSFRSAVRALSGLSLLLAGATTPAQTIKPVTSAIKPFGAAKLNADYAKLPLSFEPNRGQADPKVQFIAHSPAATVYLSGSDAYLRTDHMKKEEHGLTQFTGADTVRMHLVGASTTAAAAPSDAQPGKVSYMRGSDRSHWQTGLPTYGQVLVSAVYPGIDLKYYGHQGQLEYDFIVAPDADPSAVKLQFEGATAKIAENGDLELPSGTSSLRFDKPLAYQTVDGKRINVEASFAMSANRDVTFKLGHYDHSRELTIDPTLIYLGTLGAGAYPYSNDVSQIAVDGKGALYFIGSTQDPTFPVTAGSYQTICGPDAGSPGQTVYGGTYCQSGGGGLSAAFVTKLSPDGTQLVYSTYISGHAGYEKGVSIAVDGAGVAYLLGYTASNDFPITPDAFQTMCQPGQPINFHPTYLPPSSQCDNYHNGGGTQYTINGPVSFFAKLNAEGTSLIYSSYLGGTYPVYATQTALDASGNWYLYNQTSSATPSDLYGTGGGNVQFPGVTNSGFQSASTNRNTYNNELQNTDTVAALSKFSNDGKTLLYGSFFEDPTYGVAVSPQSMAVGANGVVFIGGISQATQLPTTPGVLKVSCTQPGSNPASCNTYDGFIAAIDTTKVGAASLVYSTRLGGTDPTQGSNIAEQQIYGLTADSSNNVYATGYTYDHTFPVGTGGYQSTCPNYDATKSTYDYCDSAFVVKINPTGTQVLAGTFLDGPSFRSAESVGYNVRLDSKGQVYLYGISNDGGGDFPQVNPLQSYKGGNQLFISAFSPDLSKLLFSTRFGNPSYPDHSVAPAGGMVLGADDTIYFAGTTKDGTFAGTPGTYSTTPASSGGNDHTFFGKLSKVLQPDTTLLTVTPNPISQNGTITYKAVVTGTLQTTPVATGTVTFAAANTTPATVLATATLDGSGTATFTGAPPAAGTYSVVASYGADANYDFSTSSPVSLVVNNTTSTTTTLTATPVTAKAGATITLSATVAGTGGTPTGTITFLDGTTSLGKGTLAGGSATFTTSMLSSTTHSITASYGGDATFSASTSAAQTLTISANAVGLNLSASPSVALPGSAITLTAALTGAGTTAATGTVTFNDGANILGMVSVASNVATLTTTNLSAGTHNITASYSGDNNYSTASAGAQNVVIRMAAGTTTTLSSSIASISSGSSVTFTATVASATTSGAPTGTVTFLDGTTTLGTGTVSRGLATYTTSTLATGSHSITASYSGDSLFLGSTATAFTQAVVAATISLGASPTSLTVTRGSSGTATITATPMGNYTGTLTFTCGTLPANATCSFSPVALTFSASATAQNTTLTFSTKSTTSAMLRNGGINNMTTQMIAAAFFLPFGLLGLMARPPVTLSRTGLLMLAIAMSFGAVGMSGCGGSSTPTVAAGTYSVPVVATVNGSTTTLNLSIVVQ